jgi:hypothetical protein
MVGAKGLLRGPWQLTEIQNVCGIAPQLNWR